MTDFADRGDGLDWARRIMLRLAAREQVGQYAQAMAREVLGLELPKPAKTDVLERGKERAAQCAAKKIRR